MPKPLQCLIAFGANLGEPDQSFRISAELLDGQGFTLLSTSRLYRTIAVGGPPNQPDFQNGAILAATSLKADEIVAALLRIEQRLGRMRDTRWGARSVDLDLLLAGDLVQSTADVVVPHPRMSWRKFVLQPAAEIAPEMIHPLSGLTVLQLLERLVRMPAQVAWLNRQPDEDLLSQVAAAIGSRGRLLGAKGLAADPGNESAVEAVGDWKVHVGRSQKEIVAAANLSRLLVWDSRQWSSDEAETEWARGFPGAVMDLGLPGLAAPVEIPAALDAMLSV